MPMFGHMLAAMFTGELWDYWRVYVDETDITQRAPALLLSERIMSKYLRI